MALQSSGFAPAGRSDAPRKQSRFTYCDGPMVFIGQQIVRLMQKSGWDAALQSPHYLKEQVYIVHRVHEKNVDPRFWTDLDACCEVMQTKYGVEIRRGVDPSRLELADWRDWWRSSVPDKLAQRFKRVLPGVWKRYEKSKGYNPSQHSA